MRVSVSSFIPTAGGRGSPERQNLLPEVRQWLKEAAVETDGREGGSSFFG